MRLSLEMLAPLSIATTLALSPRAARAQEAPPPEPPAEDAPEPAPEPPLAAPPPQPTEPETTSPDAARGAPPITKADEDARAPAASPAKKTTPAKADEDAEPEKPAWETARAERRGGFAMGVVAGGGFGAANGFPNDAKKIGLASAYTESGIGVAFASNVWAGGALADWLTFGFGADFSTVVNGDYKSEGAVVFFHTDVYPLYPVGGILRDLGVSFDFGTGAANATDEAGQKVIDGAGPSFLQTTVFLEAIPFWKVRLGPFIGEHYTFSSSIRRPVLLGGLRMSIYTSP